MKKKRPGSRRRHPLLIITLIVLVIACAAAVWLTMFNTLPLVKSPLKAAFRGKIPQQPKPVQKATSQSVPMDATPMATPSTGDGAQDERESIDGTIQTEPVVQVPELASNTPPADLENGDVQEPAPSANPATDAAEPVINPSDQLPISTEKEIEEAPEPEPAEQQQAALSQPLPSTVEANSEPAASDSSTPEAKPEPAASDMAKKTVFTIQVGAYRTKAYALEAVNQLLKNGYSAYIHETSDSRGRPWYFVRFGRFGNRDAAMPSLAAFEEKEKKSAMIAQLSRP